MVVVQTTLFFGTGVVATMDLVWFMIMLLMLLWWLMIMLLIGSFTSGWYALSWLIRVLSSMYLLLYLAMGIHLYLYSLWCSILVHNLSMQQKQEVDRPLFFFRLWSPGRMRPRRLPGSCLLTRDLHGNKHSAACYTSTVSNTPPTSVYRDECGFFAMGSNPAIQKNPNSWRDQRTNMCCFVSGIF